MEFANFFTADELFSFNFKDPNLNPRFKYFTKALGILLDDSLDDHVQLIFHEYGTKSTCTMFSRTDVFIL